MCADGGETEPCLAPLGTPRLELTGLWISASCAGDVPNIIYVSSTTSPYRRCGLETPPSAPRGGRGIIFGQRRVWIFGGGGGKYPASFRTSETTRAVETRVSERGIARAFRVRCATTTAMRGEHRRGDDRVNAGDAPSPRCPLRNMGQMVAGKNRNTRFPRKRS